MIIITYNDNMTNRNVYILFVFVHKDVHMCRRLFVYRQNIYDYKANILYFIGSSESMEGPTYNTYIVCLYYTGAATVILKVP